MHMSTITLAFFGENGINLVSHPLYSTDLTPEVFYNAVRSMAFRWKKCVAATGDYFEGCNLSMFLKQKYPQMMTKMMHKMFVPILIVISCLALKSVSFILTSCCVHTLHFASERQNIKACNCSKCTKFPSFPIVDHALKKRDFCRRPSYVVLKDNQQRDQCTREKHLQSKSKGTVLSNYAHFTRDVLKALTPNLNQIRVCYPEIRVNWQK